MSNETFKRTLLHQDDAMMQELLGDLNQFQPYLKTLKEKFNNFNFTDEPFSYSVFFWITGGGDVQQLIDKYFKQVNDSMTETGLLYDRLRNMLLEDAQQPVAEFRKAYNDLINFRPSDPKPKSIFAEPRNVVLKLDDITFDDESQTFIVSENTQKRLIENFRIYIDNQEEQDLYNTLAALRVPLLNYYAKLKQIKYPANLTQGYLPTDFLDQFFEFEPGVQKADIKPNSIKWGVSLKYRK